MKLVIATVTAHGNWPNGNDREAVDLAGAMLTDTIAEAIEKGVLVSQALLDEQLGEDAPKLEVTW